MSKRSKRDLGAMEAQFDENFADHFIEIHNLNGIVDDDSDIVYGLKGSGKTALCRVLTEISNDKFLITKFINLDSISFLQIHEALKALKQTTNKEIINLASKTWHNVLLIYGIEAFSESLDDSDPLKIKIQSFKRKKYKHKDSNNRLHSFIRNLLEKVNRLGSKTDETSELGLTKSQFEEINKTYDDELFYLIKECKKRLENEPKKILLCLDGFDSIIAHNKKSRTAIFSGLVDAIYKCAKDNFINENYCFKAFLPRELTEDMRVKHFDADKFIFNNHNLTWSKEEFKKFIHKRLSTYSKTKSKNFNDVWTEHLPEKIYNNVHSIEENTLDYILRHTLYRPRHLLIHLQYIFDEWDTRYSSQKIDPSFIPKVVSRTNIELAELITSELEYTIPNLTQFLHSFHSVSSTMSFKYFKERMKKMFSLETISDERKLFDQLYNIGLLGYFKREDIAGKKKSSIGCSFSYSNSHSNRKIYYALDDEDIVVLSPIFQEYCGCDYSEYGYVYQQEPRQHWI